jgi:3-mercaptopyruvate sulfurtransferase SseA
MPNRKLTPLILLAGLALAALACNASLPQIAQPSPTPLPTAAGFPETVDEVPRVSAQDAWQALSDGDAVIVDVRSVDAYVAKHIQGALSIPLDRIEADPAHVSLDSGKWIITYCT